MLATADTGTSNTDNRTHVVRPGFSVNLSGTSFGGSSALAAGDVIQLLDTTTSTVLGLHTARRIAARQNTGRCPAPLLHDVALICNKARAFTGGENGIDGGVVALDDIWPK